MTKAEVLNLISGAGGIKIRLYFLSQGTLNATMKEELFDDIYNYLVNNGISVNKNVIKNSLLTIEGKKTITDDTPENILSILTSKI